MKSTILNARREYSASPQKTRVNGHCDKGGRRSERPESRFESVEDVEDGGSEREEREENQPFRGYPDFLSGPRALLHRSQVLLEQPGGRRAHRLQHQRVSRLGFFIVEQHVNLSL